MKIIGIIPARYASSRFPGKPLVDIGGKSMIERVYAQAEQSAALSHVLVATDDERIAEAVWQFGGNVVMTGSHHQNGTERCCEALGKAVGHFDVVLNIQGDEPFIDPAQLDLLAACFDHPETQIATLVKKLDNPDLLQQPSVMKVVLNTRQEALYFSRSPIPHVRDLPREKWLANHTFYKHIGLYGYRVAGFREVVELPSTPLEQAESLEQLRWLEHGYPIRVAITHTESLSIDTPQDLEEALRRMMGNREQ